MPIKYHHAPDIKQRIIALSDNFPNVNPDRVHCFRSTGSQADRTLARIWSFPKIWQKALYMKPRYVIEVLSEKFDKLPKEKQDEILVHELKHIPKRFSGGLRRHDKEKLPKHIIL
ncbi:MAG: putative metallopeptidase [archaeon]